MSTSRFSKIYLPVLWIAMSAMVLASGPDEEEKEPERGRALAELRRIVDEIFPLDPYEPLKENDPGDQEPLRKANDAMATQRSSAIFEIPLAILRHHLFPWFDPQALLLGMRQTCHYFNQFSRLSSFRLNNYCLAETRVHNIPVGRLRAKTCSTQDGILRLASLMGVCSADLASWFEPAFLQAAFLRYKNTLPPQLEGQSEEDLERLYPVIKIALAAIDEAHPLDPAIMPLLQGHPQPYGLSLNKLRLLSLNPARPGIYHQTLEQLVNSPNGYLHTSASQERTVIARELLIARRNIASFVYDPQKRGIAIQLIDWCVRNPQFCDDHNSRLILIHNALSLGHPDLAVEVLRGIIALPDNVDTLPHKIQAFSHDKIREIEDRDIQSCIRQFSENLYPYWGQLPAYVKLHALSLLMQGEKRKEVQEAMGDLLQLMDDPLQCEGVISGACPYSVFTDLSDYNYPEELENLTHWLLNTEINRLIPLLWRFNIDDVFTKAIKINREKSIALLKALIESDQAHIQDKIDALAFLAQHAIEEIDQQKSISFIKTVLESDQVNMNPKLNALFFLAQHATQEVDREQSIFRLKALIEAEQVNIDTKFGFLIFLAQHMPKEVNYIVSQVNSLNDELRHRDDIDKHLFIIHYYLNNQGLCHFYYQKSIQKALRNEDPTSLKNHQETVKKLQDAGLPVERFEDLLGCDPFTVFPVLLAKKD